MILIIIINFHATREMVSVRWLGINNYNDYNNYHKCLDMEWRLLMTYPSGKPLLLTLDAYFMMKPCFKG